MVQDMERATRGAAPNDETHPDLEWRQRNGKTGPAPKPQAKPRTRVRVFVNNIFGKTIAKQTLAAKNPSTGQVFSPVRNKDGWVIDIFGKVSDLKLTITGRDDGGDYADEIVLMRLRSDGTAEQVVSDTSFNTSVKNLFGTQPVPVQVDVTLSRLKQIRLEDITDTNGEGRNFAESKKVPCAPSPRANLMNSFQLQFGSTAEHAPAIFVFDVVHLPTPFRIGVAMRKGLLRPSKILMFFHPPARLAGLTGGDSYPTAYNDLLFRYVSGNSPADKHLAYQLCESGRDLLLFFPLGHAELGMGVFSRDSGRTEEVFLEVLAHFRRRFNSEFLVPRIDALVLASFSAGIGALLDFLRNGGKLLPLVREVYDYDGALSTFNVGEKFPPSYAPALHTKGRKALIYTQNPTGNWQRLIRSEREFPLPFPRWKKCLDPLPPPSASDLVKAKAAHQLIPRYMLLHSLAMSNL